VQEKVENQVVFSVAVSHKRDTMVLRILLQRKFYWKRLNLDGKKTF
jgi:hypothetical protein